MEGFEAVAVITKEAKDAFSVSDVAVKNVINTQIKLNVSNSNQKNLTMSQ